MVLSSFGQRAQEYQAGIILVTVVTLFGFTIQRLCAKLRVVPENLSSENQAIERPAAHYRTSHQLYLEFERWNKM